MPGDDGGLRSLQSALADASALARAIRLATTGEDTVALALEQTLAAITTTANAGEIKTNVLAGGEAVTWVRSMVDSLKHTLESAPGDWPSRVAVVNATAARILASVVSSGPDSEQSSASARQISGAAVALQDRDEMLLRSTRTLEGASRTYERDARRQSQLATLLYLAAAGLVALAIVLSWAIVFRPEFRALGTGGLVSRLLPGLLLLGLAAAGGQQAQRVRRNAEELRRVRRQLVALPGYLLPLPVAAQDLLRAAMLPRLFPRLLEDNDPMREEDWFPDGDQVLAAVDFSVLENLARVSEPADSDDGDDLRPSAEPEP